MFYFLLVVAAVLVGYLVIEWDKRRKLDDTGALTVTKLSESDSVLVEHSIEQKRIEVIEIPGRTIESDALGVKVHTTMEVRIDHESRDKFKQIRALIREAKDSGDIDGQMKHLKDFQEFIIDSDFSHGTGEMYRFVKFLEQHGFTERAAEERKHVDDAQWKFFQQIKQKRLEQLRRLNPAVIRFSAHDDAPSQCRAYHEKTEPLDDGPILEHFRTCSYRPRCLCTVGTVRQPR